MAVKLAHGTKVKWGDGGAGAAKATKSHGSTDSNLTFEAVTAGTLGNSITITLTNPGGTADLAVTVVDYDITVALGVSSGSIVSTANDVIAGIYQTAAAKALVNVSSVGDGTGVVTALSKANLTGGTNSAETFYDLTGIDDITLDPGSYSRMDITSHSSTGPQAEMINEAFTSEGSVSFSMKWNISDTGHIALETDFDDNTSRNVQIIPPTGGGQTRSFVAQVTSLSEAYPVKGVITRDVKLGILGAITKS